MAQGIRHAEPSLVGLDLSEEYPFEQQVADFAAQIVVVAAVDRVEHLVCLFEHEASQGLEGLLAVPWAAVRAAQARHDVGQLLELVARGALRQAGRLLDFRHRGLC